MLKGLSVNMMSAKKAALLTDKSTKRCIREMFAEIEKNITAACNQGKNIYRYRFFGDTNAAEIFKPFIMPELLRQGYRVSVGADSLTETATIEWR